jgi:hypothetical protein
MAVDSKQFSLLIKSPVYSSIPPQNSHFTSLKTKTITLTHINTEICPLWRIFTIRYFVICVLLCVERNNTHSFPRILHYKSYGLIIKYLSHFNIKMLSHFLSYFSYYMRFAFNALLNTCDTKYHGSYFILFALKKNHCHDALNNRCNQIDPNTRRGQYKPDTRPVKRRPAHCENCQRFLLRFD